MSREKKIIIVFLGELIIAFLAFIGWRSIEPVVASVVWPYAFLALSA